jgi:hypothetical protein
VAGEGYASFYLILLISPSISMLSMKDTPGELVITSQRTDERQDRQNGFMASYALPA